MGVVRVRQSGMGAPLTEFDVPKVLFERCPGRYVLVDGVERSVPMRATFPEPEPEPVVVVEPIIAAEPGEGVVSADEAAEVVKAIRNRK